MYFVPLDGENRQSRTLTEFMELLSANTTTVTVKYLPSSTLMLLPFDVITSLRPNKLHYFIVMLIDSLALFTCHQIFLFINNMQSARVISHILSNSNSILMIQLLQQNTI